MKTNLLRHLQEEKSMRLKGGLYHTTQIKLAYNSNRKECLKHDIVPFIIEDEYKMFYYRGLKEFEKTPGYLMDTCLSAQDKYREMAGYFLEG